MHTSRIAAFARRPSGRFADFREIGVHTCLCLKLVRRRSAPRQATKADLEQAHLILSEFGLLIGPAGAMSDVIARAVAAGIALGRKEALTAARRGDKSKSSR